MTSQWCWIRTTTTISSPPLSPFLLDFDTDRGRRSYLLCRTKSRRYRDTNNRSSSISRTIISVQYIVTYYLLCLHKHFLLGSTLILLLRGTNTTYSEKNTYYLAQRLLLFCSEEQTQRNRNPSAVPNLLRIQSWKKYSTTPHRVV